MTDEAYDPQPAASAPWALVILAAALCLVLGSSVVDVLRANSTLANVDKQQTMAVTQSHRAEDQLNALARGTQELADSGNANAQAIVATLQNNGVHINLNGGGAGK